VIYRWLLSLGEVAFNLSLLAALLVLVVGLRGWRGAVAATAAALVVGAPGVAAPLGWSLAAALVMAVAVVVLGGAALVRGPRWPLLVVLGTHLLVYLVTAGQLAWSGLGLPDGLPGAGTVLRGGELLALLAPLMLLVRPRWGHVAVGLGSVAALGAAYLVNPDITAILAMYSLGFSLSWPVWIYLGALGLGVPGLIALFREDRLRGLALGLLFLAGYSLTINQQHLLVLAGWAVLALPEAVTERVIAV
jgi:hypothetical protein